MNDFIEFEAVLHDEEKTIYIRKNAIEYIEKYNRNVTHIHLKEKILYIRQNYEEFIKKLNE